MYSCHPKTEDPKVALLDKLYKADGREDKSHPLHARYTGLYQKYTNGELDVPS